MKKFIFLFLIFLITTTSAIAGEITKTKLPSGQTVIVKEIHTNPIVIIDTWVKTGSIDENNKNNGVAHFLEHLFFKGSKNYPDNKFDKILESKGAQTNAATSKDYTHFYILLPSKDFETALKLHADMLTQPLLPTKEINKERNVVIREIERNNDNPSRILSKKFNQALYTNHPYKREVIGTKEIIANISRDEINNFYKEHYSPENMITVIVGDIDAQKATEAAKKYFACTSANQKAVKNKYKADKKPEKQIYINSKEDVKTSDLVIGYKCGLKVTDKDSYALDLIAAILGDGKSSRLYREIKDKQQSAQGVYASHLSLKEDSVFMIGADLNEKNIDNVTKAIFCEIDKIKTQKVPQEELDRAKNMIERATLFSRESVADNASEIGYSTLLTGDWNYSEEYLNNIKKVTAEDIQKAAKKYLDENHTIIASITPKNPETAAQTKQISSSKEATCTPVISADKYFKPSDNQPLKQEKINNIETYTLKNGAELIIDKHKNNEIIALNMKIKGGGYTETIPGLGTITAAVLDEGTERYSKDIFAKLSEENGIKISASNDAEYFSISLKCTKPDLPLALDMFYQVLNKAIIDEAEVEKAKQDTLYSIIQSRDNASTLAFEEVTNELWKNTPYNRTGKRIEKYLPKITKQDVSDFYKNVFDAKNAIIAINGDVNSQEMINYFSEAISVKNGKKINYEEYKNLFDNLNENKIITQQQGKEAAWLVFAWKTDGIENHKDRITLKVINTILGGGMSSRLFSKVRAQKGLAYVVGSTTPAYVNKGSFCMYIGTDPQKIEDAEKAMLFELNRLKKEFVSDKELEYAKSKLKGEAVVLLETNAAKANLLSTCKQNGNGVDYYFEKFNKEVDSVTVTDIITVANKYFSRPYILSKVLPKK